MGCRRAARLRPGWASCCGSPAGISRFWRPAADPIAGRHGEGSQSMGHVWSLWRIRSRFRGVPVYKMGLLRLNCRASIAGEGPARPLAEWSDRLGFSVWQALQLDRLGCRPGPPVMARLACGLAGGCRKSPLAAPSRGGDGTLLRLDFGLCWIRLANRLAILTRERIWVTSRVWVATGGSGWPLEGLDGHWAGP